MLLDCAQSECRNSQVLYHTNQPTSQPTLDGGDWIFRICWIQHLHKVRRADRTDRELSQQPLLSPSSFFANQHITPYSWSFFHQSLPISLPPPLGENTSRPPHRILFRNIPPKEKAVVRCSRTVTTSESRGEKRGGNWSDWREENNASNLNVSQSMQRVK